MLRLIKSNLVSFFVLLILSSCGSTRNLTHFSDINDSAEYKSRIQNEIQVKIQPGDLLSVVVNSTNLESNVLFNKGTSIVATSVAAGGSQEGYLVDKDGRIDFPYIGKVKLEGYTKEEAMNIMTQALHTLIKSGTVSIGFLNYRITVIGEVNRPASFTLPNEKINVLEALGMAGDMTPYGRRENVLIIRESGNIRTTTRINLTEKSVLNSPYFYLQQNDIIYVAPDKAKALQASSRAVNLPIYISIASIIAILITRF